MGFKEHIHSSELLHESLCAFLMSGVPYLMQVFDGHSGETAACFAEQHLLPNLLREESFLTAPAEALVRTQDSPRMSFLCIVDSWAPQHISHQYSISYCFTQFHESVPAKINTLVLSTASCVL